jgi:hypothetical protein
MTRFRHFQKLALKAQIPTQSGLIFRFVKMGAPKILFMFTPKEIFHFSG